MQCIYENINAKKSQWVELIGVRFTINTHTEDNTNYQKCNRMRKNILTWPIPTANEEGNLSGKTQKNSSQNNKHLNEMHRAYRALETN